MFVKAAIALLTLVTIAAFTFFNAPVFAEEENEVTVPINQVVKMSKLSAEQLAKSKVTVPRSWVDQEYLEEHFPQEGESKSKSSISNIPDGTYTQKPEITSDQNNAIEISNFSFELTYDKGTLLEAKATFSLKSESEAIEDVRLVLDGDNSLTPTDGAYDESVEDFSYTTKGLKAGNLYRGTLEVSSESNSDSIEFKIYPREFVNIADDDKSIIGAHYYAWYAENWSNVGNVYTPLLGTYSSKNEEVVNKHIDWATGHGIDTLIITWNGKDKWTDSIIKNRLLKSYLIDEISFFLLYGWGGKVGKVDFNKNYYRKKFKSDFKYFNQEYFDHPQYLEIKGKKPVFLWGSKVMSGDLASVFKDVRELSGKYANDLYLIGTEMGFGLVKEKPWVKKRIKQMEIFDAISSYTQLYHDFKGDYESFVGKHKGLFRELNRKVPVDFIPYVQPGNNASKSKPKIPVLKRDPDIFREFCQTAKENVEEGLNIIFISSWNEWPEGHQVEPAKEYGFKYLEIIKNTLAGN
ncbi:glycoside hydrolase family 99-like domain-containing protein [Candidatus Bipolaricaulota bacterium]|nr:glycoside hydrolase family 99-like domain-containing protein [Candidatus Bipolaricaulota bacterium]